MRNHQTFFDFAAAVGLTKHYGGIETTQALAELCHIGEGKYVLDVGCGVGVTPCFLARKYGCRVVGVDIVPAMVERSRERAKREGLSDRVEFRVADARDLPFENNLFDAVITESVFALLDEKQKALDECVRVVRPGGYIGLNESVWLQSPPPPEIVTWASQDIGASVKALTSGEWMGLLESAGLTEITAQTYKINVQSESKAILQRYGYVGMLRVFGRMLLLYARNPAYRKFVREIRRGGIVPKDLDEYLGYGLFIGRKQIQNEETR